MSQQVQDYQDNNPELDRIGSPEVSEIVWVRIAELDDAVRLVGATFAQNFGEYTPLDPVAEGSAKSVDLSKTVPFEARPVAKAVVELEGTVQTAPVGTPEGISEQEDKKRRTQQALWELKQIDD